MKRFQGADREFLGLWGARIGVAQKAVMRKLAFRTGWGILAVVMVWAGCLNAVQIVTDSPNTSCEELQLAKELRIYKDPTIFLANLGLIYSNPSQGWAALMEESPLLTTVKGRVQLMRLGPPREFRSFGGISRLYETVDRRLRAVDSPARSKKGREPDGPTMIIPVKVCGGAYDAYKDSLGFVLVADLKQAQQDDSEDGQMPPSTLGNPIPKLRTP